MNGFALTDPIWTERLVLRAFEPGDADAIYAMRSDADVVRYLEWGPRTRDEGDVLSLAVTLPATGELVGDVGSGT